MVPLEQVNGGALYSVDPADYRESIPYGTASCGSSKNKDITVRGRANLIFVAREFAKDVVRDDPLFIALRSTSQRTGKERTQAI